ncbi:MAG: 4Fe-4S binding protein [Candidatus Kaelpia aquatica]|nr:4Fe-4S binding protein [Candidatus Kaelpia aquatica]
MKKNIYKIIFFALGAFTIISQTILLREYLISFKGNELSIGIFYASWFLWIAIGATLTRKYQKISKLFPLLLKFYPFLAIFQFLLFRFFRPLASIEPWELFPLQKAIPLSILFNGPLSLFTGILFTSGCQLLKKYKQSFKNTISDAYIFESLGSVAAGILVTLLLINLFPTTTILIACCLFFAIIVSLESIYRKSKTGRALSSLSLILFSLFFIYQRPLEKHLNDICFKQIIPDAELIETINTPYQQISIAKYREKIIVLSNGEIIQTLPDKISSEESVSLFVAMSDMPKDILILGEGFENQIKTFLDFNIRKIVNIYKDNDYFNFIKKHAPPEINKIFKDERVKFIFKDPRNYVKEQRDRYDLIIINEPEPSSAYTNKLYTKEFYRLLKYSLKDSGNIAVRIASAENFLSKELKNYGSSIYHTLQSEFEKIMLVPGDNLWFFAGSKNSNITQSADELYERGLAYIPDDYTFSPESFYSLIDKDRVEFIENSYLQNNIYNFLINSDKRPLSYFLNLLVLTEYSGFKITQTMRLLFVYGFPLFAIAILIFFILRIHYLKFIANEPQVENIFNAKLYQVFSGASAFIYYIVLLFLFQNIFGTIYIYIGLLSSLFMLGLVLGGLSIKNITEKIAPFKIIISILSIQLLIYLFSFYLFKEAINDLPNQLSIPIFSSLFLFSGILTGASYPLAAKALENKHLRLISLAGILQSLDHWGAAIGSTITGMILIPLLGISKTLLFLSILTFAVLLLIKLGTNTSILKKRIFNLNKLSFPYIKTSYFLFGISLLTLLGSSYIKSKPYAAEESSMVTSIGIQEEKEKGYHVFDSRELGTSSEGFAGLINIEIKTDSNYKIMDLKIIEPRETSSYLKRVEPWLNNFKGRTLTELYRINNIDAVTSATYTSEAIIETVEKTAQKISKDSVREDLRIDSMPSSTEIFKSIIFILFILIGLYIFHKNRSSKIERLYQLLVVIILGLILQLQLSLLHIFNILNLNLPSIKNISLLTITFIPFILALIYGRIYCGFLCPFGALQKLLNIKKLRVEPSKELDSKMRYIKYILLSMVIMLFFITKNNYIFWQEPLSQLTSIFSKPGLNSLLLYTALLFSLFIPRFWCRYFCVVGALLSMFNKISLFNKLFKKRFSCCELQNNNPQDLECIQCKIKCYEKR